MEIKDIFCLGELFEKVQMQGVFADSKTFVDCTPKLDYASILERYEDEKNKDNFSLADFVHEYFTLPTDEAATYESTKGMPLIQHLEILWDVLTRAPEKSTNSLISLPKSYIVPGGRFREIYYWDSYFTMLGLQISKRIDLVQNMVDNFAYLIDTIGYIPNGNRRYYVGRSQPPFFSCMIRLLREEKGEQVLIDYLPQLEKEYNFWMRGRKELTADNVAVHRVVRLSDGSILNRYWDESDTPRPEAFKEEINLAKASVDKKRMYRNLRAAAESGWDFSSRWFKNKNDFSSIHTGDIIPVDLNCLLLHLEQTIADAYLLATDNSSCRKYQTLANKRKTAIDKYCWNEEKGFYFDYDFVAGNQKDCPTLAAAFPLFFGISSLNQAISVANNLQEKFLSNGGLVTTCETTGQQWDSPNGWAPLQWIAVIGLTNYDQIDLAKEIATRWMRINVKIYETNGKMVEKYNVVDTATKAGGGEYPAQDGFGWTNGVYLGLNNWMQNLSSKNAPHR